MSKMKIFIWKEQVCFAPEKFMAANFAFCKLKIIKLFHPSLLDKLHYWHVAENRNWLTANVSGVFTGLVEYFKRKMI